MGKKFSNMFSMNAQGSLGLKVQKNPKIEERQRQRQRDILFEESKKIIKSSSINISKQSWGIVIPVSRP
jgi:hypothetical protein